MSFVNKENLKNILKEFGNKINKNINDDSTATRELINNPNLLINPDFKVNQRLYTTYNTNLGYTADRWWMVNGTSSTGTVTINSDNISLSNFNETQLFIGQIMEDIECTDLKNTSLTLSAKVKVSNMTSGSLFLSLKSTTTANKIDLSSGSVTVIASKNVSYSDLSSDWQTISVTGVSPSDLTNIEVLCGSHKDLGGMPNNDAIIDIAWIKLEKGSKPTANTPSIYSIEEFKCKRYYQLLDGQIQFPICWVNANYVQIFPNLNTTMRISPTVSIRPESTTITPSIVAVQDNTTMVYGFTFSSALITNSFFKMTFYKSAHGIVRGHMEFGWMKIGLDSEIH